MISNTPTTTTTTGVTADEFISESAELICKLHKQTTGNILEIGRRLIAVKALLRHGQFGTWVKVECSFGERTASRYMNAAKAFEGKTDTVSEISISILHALSKPKVSVKTREETLAAVHDGTITTTREVKTAVIGNVQSEVLSLKVSGPATPSTASVAKARLKMVEKLILTIGSPHSALDLINEAQVLDLRPVVSRIIEESARAAAELDARQMTLFKMEPSRKSTPDRVNSEASGS